MQNIIQISDGVGGLDRWSIAYGQWRRPLRGAIHFFAYHFILKRRTTRRTRAAGFRLTVRPTVFHPRYFLTSEFFALFIGWLDMRGKRVADVGTGCGILALSAARAGATRVTAIDINPNAALAAVENARANGFENRVSVICSNLLSALAPVPRFDIIISSPPSFPGEPRDLADRAWHAGPNYRNIASLFHQARERLAPGGRLYILLSSDSDLDLFSAMISRARFRARRVAERSVLIESPIIYALQAAWSRMAEIYDELGKRDRARDLRRKAEERFARFNEIFWDEDSGFYALCLDGDKNKVMTVASNPGRRLWSRIVPPERAERVVSRLLQPDMWSGWGIRTLSARHPRYNPMSYQNGSVWPHDNGFIAIGFKQYGFAEAAARVARAVCDAGGYFALYQMPELYASNATTPISRSNTRTRMCRRRRPLDRFSRSPGASRL